jgi:parallel beta-helix repeat protein
MSGVAGVRLAPASFPATAGKCPVTAAQLMDRFRRSTIMHISQSRRVLSGTAALVAGAAAATLALAAPVMAATTATTPASAARTLYVAPHGHKGARDNGCTSAAFATIRAGVSAAPAGSTVVVCAGTYAEGVTLAKKLSLVGSGHAMIDASGKINGVLVRASYVSVRGLVISGAIGEGILIDHASHVTVADNLVADNDLGGQPDPVKNNYAECATVDNVPGDCGEGIHLMGATYSVVSGNISTGNTGGILLSDETGPTAHNKIIGNTVTGNLYDCGITVVSHNPKAAPGGKPAPKVAGTYDNLIADNTITQNGTAGDGAGVILATPFPGGAVYSNTVTGNTIAGNGLAGVTVHSHAPGQDLNGNVIEDNTIGVNNLDGDSDFAPATDLLTTGILAATVAPLSITVTGNTIAGDHYGIWTTGPVALKLHGNILVQTTVGVGKS